MPRPTEERSCLRCGHAEIEHTHYRQGTECSHYDLAHGVISPRGETQIAVRVQCPCQRFVSNRIGWWLDRLWRRLSAILRPLWAK